MRFVMNFTMGMLGALAAFYWYLWDIVTSYQASPLVGLGFASLAIIAATSFVASFLVGLYAATAGTVYVAVKAAGPGGLKLGNGGRRRQGYIRQGRDGGFGGGFGARRRQGY